jgi:nucleoside-diphosphate-sugar epimerase
MKILVTGAASFIGGMHAVPELLAESGQVVGGGHLHDYCDPRLKAGRLQQLAGHTALRMLSGDAAVTYTDTLWMRRHASFAPATPRQESAAALSRVIARVTRELG